MDFSYKEIESILSAAGFKEDRVTGSHHIYVNKETGLSQPLPRHTKNIPMGTSKSIIEFAILVATLQNIDLMNKKYKFSKNAYTIIEKHCAEIRKSKLNLIPASIRNRLNIQNETEAMKYIKQLMNRIKQFPPTLPYLSERDFE